MNMLYEYNKEYYVPKDRYDIVVNGKIPEADLSLPNANLKAPNLKAPNLKAPGMPNLKAPKVDLKAPELKAPVPKLPTVKAKLPNAPKVPNMRGKLPNTNIGNGNISLNGGQVPNLNASGYGNLNMSSYNMNLSNNGYGDAIGNYAPMTK